MDQKITRNEQKVTSNEQKVTSNKQRAKRFTSDQYRNIPMREKESKQCNKKAENKGKLK